jgi:hypothetical protein
MNASKARSTTHGHQDDVAYVLSSTTTCGLWHESAIPSASTRATAPCSMFSSSGCCQCSTVAGIMQLALPQLC